MKKFKISYTREGEEHAVFAHSNSEKEAIKVFKRNFKGAFIVEVEEVE